jgi:hypothetical protein
MNFLPLGMIFSFPVNIQLIYFAACFVVAILGINKNMGFWGYLFFSVLFSPLLGLIIVAVSGGKKEKTKN